MKKYTSYILTFFLYCITLYVATQCRYPEIDEIYFTDASANLVLNGSWESHILFSQFFYQPLHAFLLIPWMALFGVSHFAVCGFGVFLGFLTCVFLVHFVKSLRLSTTIWQELLLAVSFWGFNTFTDYETFGRPDNLGMLITLFVIYQYLKYPSIQFWKSVLLGILLVLVGLYEIPVMAIFFSIMIILKFKDWHNIILWVRKGLWFLCGLLIGEGIVFLLFFYNKANSLLGYVKYSFGMASSSNSVFSRLLDGYSTNWYMTAIFVVLVAIIVYKKISVSKVITILIVLIPALMVLAGRYLPYYAWIYYIPLCVYTIYYMRAYKALAAFFSISFVVSSVVFFATQWYTTYGCQTGTIGELEIIKKECHSFFESNKNLISEYDNVVLSEEQLYYDVINTGALVWFQYRKNISHKLDFYNFERMNRSISKGESKIEKYRKAPTYGFFVNHYLKYNDNPPYFPEKGLCVYMCEMEKSTSLNFLRHFGYNYKCLKDNGKCSIYMFSK